MATSTIIIYKTPLTPEKNAWIDDMTTFLVNSQLCTIGFQSDACQYVKHDLNVSIKISMQQAVMYETLGNYCSITNTDDPYPFYYFIMGYKWKSNNCIELSLSLDTINTFCPWNQDIFSDKTNIIREHLPRFYANPIDSIYQRDIDRVSEGIQPTFQEFSSEEFLDTLNVGKFYLVYRTSKDLSPDNIDNPVNCYLLADKELLFKKSTSNPVIELLPSDLTSGRYYYAVIDDNGEDAQIYDPTNDKTITLTNVKRVIIFSAIVNKITIQSYNYEYKNGNYVYTGLNLESANTESIVLKSIRGLRVGTDELKSISDILKYPFVEYNSGITIDLKTIPFKNLDRTDNRIVKILQLPYCPVPISENEQNEIVIDIEKWQYDQGMLKLKDLSIDFERKLPTNLDLNGELNAYGLQVDASNIHTLKNKKYESKLFHSDFYIDKIVYDTFAWQFKHENAQQGLWDKLDIVFKMTNTMNSRMLFQVVFNGPPWNTQYLKESDYEGILMCNRNNEMTIYNSDYINYIKNGFNYDKKQQEQQIRHSWIGTSIQVAGAVVSGIVGAFTGNPISAVASIGLAVSAVSSISGNINSAISSQRQIDAKLQSLASQGFRTAGADDVDLLRYYNGNLLIHKVYIPSSLVRDSIFDLFFYTGYSHPVQDKPILNSRRWFNFIQCQAVFKQSFINEVANDFINDIKVRFGTGVTKYHYINTGFNVYEYDMEQKYENFESFF